MTTNPMFDKFKKEYPEVHFAFTKMYNSSSGTLSEKSRQLIYVGILTCTGYGPAIKVHIHKALKAGASIEEIKEATALAIPAAGATKFLSSLPYILDALEY
jgi:AhpD family alkylhydroperoxidase